MTETGAIIEQKHRRSCESFFTRKFPLRSHVPFSVVVLVSIYYSARSTLPTFLTIDVITCDECKQNAVIEGNMSNDVSTPTFILEPIAVQPESSTTEPFVSEFARYNSSQLLAWLAGYSQRDLMESWNETEMLLQRLPVPVHQDVEIYNLVAWRKLRSLLGLETSLGTVPPRPVLCVSGGSVSANAKIQATDRFDLRFVEMLNISHNIETDRLQLVNRGHGMRDSSHTAFLMHYYVPATTNILIWEFSINDSNQANCSKVNNMFVPYLNQIAHDFKDDPPLVILVYLWDKWETTKTELKGINSTVFQCHNRLASSYDFVVGSVYLGSYLAHLKWQTKIIRSTFVVDRAHPSSLGHSIVAFLLWDLVTNGTRIPIAARQSIDLPVGGAMKPTLKNCTSRDSKTINLKNLQENKFSTASWTDELPKNQNHTPGMIYPNIVSTISSTSINMQLSRRDYGKDDKARSDRKYALILPCCKSQNRISFDLSQPINETIDGGRFVSAIQLYLGRNFSSDTLVQVDLSVVDDTKQVSQMTSISNDTTLWVHPSTENEGCLIAYFTHNSWLLLPQPTLISRINLCDRGNGCMVQNPRTRESIAHIALF